MRFNEAISFEYVSDSSASLQSNSNSEFGNFQDTGDWVECESKSFPGRTYFFNMRTLCTTWSRPVSRDVTLPRYRERLRIYDKNFTHDIDNQPTIVSSESEDNRRLPITKSGHNLRRSPSEIIAWLYHGSDINMNRCFNDDQSDYRDSFVSDTLKVLCNEEDPRSVYKESAFYEVGDHFLTNKYEFDKIRILNGVVQNVAPTADYLEVKLSTSNDAIKTAERNGPPTNKDDDSLIVEKRTGYFSSSSENCRSAVLVPNYFAPRLPRIKSKYLLKEKLRVGRKRTVSKKKSVRKTPRKIICEMYGTKTINYDPIELDLPPGVKRTNLSDSSATSSLWREEHAKTPVDLANFQLADLGLRPYNLSSDSTTSSSCSSCTCSSTSSDTSQKSSSNTSKREEK
ncbi:uncharacterized protein LOC143353878 [Halictus rubicundus]|uniref:uncharacterized protein LOC143353878 n=1 Tax=Halictus rubicundus TaxID=77578 RepID=UPI00403705EC